MKYLVCQIDPIVGDIAGNIAIISNYIAIGEANHCEVAIFPELAICGYPPDDLLDYNYFIDKCELAVLNLAKTIGKMHVIVGGVAKNNSNIGRKLFNAAFVLHEGKIKHTIYKTLLPTYDIFSEKRYFEPNQTFKLIEINQKKIAITICEDIWDNHNSFNYAISPVNELAKLMPDFHINICASPFYLGKDLERVKVIKDSISRMGCGMIYINQSAAHTGILFDGSSQIYNKQGDCVVKLPLFLEAHYIYDDEKVSKAFNEAIIDPTEGLYNALVFGIRSYFDKMGFKKSALLGSSGGIDSAVVQALASAALGAENVLAVLMPSSFSSPGSIEDAAQLSNNLGNPSQILPISSLYDNFLETLAPIFKETTFSVAEENIQARSRGILLMAISNKTGRFLLNTSNKSEMAVGYTTLYGDMCGGLCPIGDVYKTVLYDLARFINREKEIIPFSIINKQPSAELRPNQKDSDSLPEYPILDAVLNAYIEQKLGKDEIADLLKLDDAIIARVVNLVNNSEFKRWQAAPVIKITTKDFSYGRKMPLVSKYE